tara:strand:+ start:6633 stop:6998 length:366 start_codon:yes stop_codon:yes gene_type:complete
MNYFKIFIFFMFIFSVSHGEENIKNKIYKNLRCLVCQGQNIGDSNSDFAQTIKSVINEKLTEGMKEKEIYSFLAEKYGDWILYKPPFKSNSYVLWILPYVIFFLGALILFFFLRKNSINKK